MSAPRRGRQAPHGTGAHRSLKPRANYNRGTTLENRTMLRSLSSPRDKLAMGNAVSRNGHEFAGRKCHPIECFRFRTKFGRGMQDVEVLGFALPLGGIQRDALTSLLGVGPEDVRIITDKFVHMDDSTVPLIVNHAERRFRWLLLECGFKLNHGCGPPKTRS